MTPEERFQQVGRDGKEYRGAPFWSWNDDLDPDELRRQVRSMCASGMGGFFMHARIGLITPYMSQEFMDCHRVCVEEARRLGMGAWLYDEDCWPSGSGGGVTPAKGPFYQAKRLTLDTVTGGELDPSPNTVAVFTCESEGDAVISCERVPDSSLRSAVGRKLLHIQWRPVGYIDALSEEAVDQFIDNTHEAFARTLSGEFGKTIPGIFTDEPNYRRPPWTLDFADEFKARMGYDITDRLAELFHAVGSYRRTRHDYWRVATELYVEAFSRRIYGWCDRHGLKLTGHQLWEDSLETQISHAGAVMPHYEYMQVPGIDHLCRRITDPVLVKQVSSVAHQFGGRRVLSEMFGCSGWNMSFEDQKWIGEWQYALGVDSMCQHLSLYSLKGCRKRDYPPSIHHQQPWWPLYNEVENHFARLACALTSGTHVADALVIHPIESAWADYDLASPSEKVRELNESLVAVSRFLQEFHVDYDYGDESILERHASVEHGQVRVGSARYGLVIIPPVTTLRESTVRLLGDWIQQGGAVIVCQQKPTQIDCRENDAIKVVLEDQRVVPVDFDALREAVFDAIGPRLQVLDEYGSDARTIYFQQRDLGGKQLFFLVNIDNKTERYDSVIRFAGSGKVEEWDLDTGEIAELPVKEIGGFSVVEREFAPTQSRLLSFDPTQRPRIGEPERWMVAEEEEITGPWKLRRTEPNAITLDYCRCAVGDGEFGDMLPVVWLAARLSGIDEETPVTMHYVFETDFSEQRERGFTLVMERPEAFDEIRVNGHRIAYVDSGWWCDIAFKKIDIGLYVQPGENVIEMRCAYLGESGRRRRMAELGVESLRSRMWTNPPPDAREPILLPYGGETAEIIKEYNRLKYGLELESVYVIGDFAVRQTRPGRFVLVDEAAEVDTGDLVDRGYCFYRGGMVYEGRFDYRDRGEDMTVLALESMGGVVARVFVNGEEAGKIKWRPMELDISDLVRSGSNDLRIEIWNSCRNLLGPHHHTGGELTAVGPGSFGAEAGYAGMEGVGDRGQRALREWTDAYNFVPTGLVSAPRLVYMRRE